ncbi:JAB domain-containing protein [Metabacillus fastidiosus]|uniref:JAB domain-containing protein n=1 Tax=Metabacillus fastidiosus TaxID=1458 RepID=A0ABU6P0A5_9BACI|nr:JAB domain-containing protein [Metabacillus fastidiosus]
MFRYEDQPTAIKICDIGSLNASIVPPREYHKPFVLNNAAFILEGHNDLSGQAASLGEAGKIISIDVLDYIILGDCTFVSLKQKGICEGAKERRYIYRFVWSMKKTLV